MPDTAPDDPAVRDSLDHVTVVGEETVVVPVPTPDETGPDLTEVTTGFSCDTGTSASGTWRGLPVADLLDRAAVPADTTHLVLESHDGFRVCVPVRTAMPGVLAVALDGDPIDDARTRFVAPDLGSTRSIRDTRTVEGVSLAPGEDSSEYESIVGDDEDDGTDGDATDAADAA